MKKNFLKILILFITILILCFLYFVNRIVISIRLNELRSYLQETDKSEGGIDHIALIATYEIHKKIYEKRMSRDEADTTENRINSLTLPVYPDNKTSGISDSIIILPALHLINFNRRILGKPPVNYRVGNDNAYRELDKAYYYERNYMYKRAITHYEKALESNTFNSRYRSSILLRQGYCYALAGNNARAMSNYRTIINDFSQESSAITASILIRYLEGFTMARERVLLNETDPVLKSRQLVDLLAYEQALRIIEDIEDKSAKSDLPSLRYFKARCYSGLGQPDKAVENYLNVITTDPASPYARFSNRKLYMIGKAAGGENRILELSRSINSRLKDPVLSEIINTDGETVSSDSRPEEPVIIDIPDNLSDKISKITEDIAGSEEVLLVIVTSDGNTFKGRLIEKNSYSVSLQTSIGRIDVKKDKIQKITEVK